MSIYGNLLCYDCKQVLWLGKAIYVDAQVAYYHLGNTTETPNRWGCFDRHFNGRLSNGLAGTGRRGIEEQHG